MIPKEFKMCTKCKKILSLEYFPIRTVRGKQVYRPRCRECHNKESSIWQSNNYHRHWANATIQNHKRNGYIVLLTREELTQKALTTQCCELCGKKLHWGIGKKKISKDSPTLDRVENGDILNMDNIMILCNACNSAKSNMSFTTFVDMCGRIYKKWGINNEQTNIR